MLLLVLAACLATVSAQNITKDATETNNNATKEILKASETGDPSKVEIVKQIRRLNEDGSYTVGYEAGDGTFKIESRDVLGNVKGTFGYVDRDGEIKRVTYSSSSDSTPTAVPVTTTKPTTSSPVMIVRMNKTVSSTTRRPLGTVVYPTRTSFTTRGTVIQPIPKRRQGSTTRTSTYLEEVTTEKQNLEASTSNILNLYKPKTDEISKTKSQILRPISDMLKDDLITRQSTTKIPHTIKPVYENTNEKVIQSDPNKANTIRRQLTGTSPNPHMLNLRQSVGDDSTDVYGSHLSLGTVRPLFTTTTPRPRLVPIHSIVAARQRIQNQYQEAPAQEEETTIEASTGRVFDQDNVVTSNPVPVIQIPAHRDIDERLYQQPIYRRPQPSAIHFRTEEYLRDNPGSAIPIGNQRPFLAYEYQNKVLEPQYVKEPIHAQNKANTPEAATVSPYDNRPVTRIIQVPVDERGVPIQGYQRFVNPYQPPQRPQPVQQPRYELVDEMNQISAPVSTRDLKRLLQILILRQNRLQALMDQIVAPGPPYQPLPLFRQEQPQYEQYNRYQNTRQYPDDENYDYRYQDQQRYRQQELYTNQVPSYDNPQYESQRYVPRRRLYTRPYDATGSSSNHINQDSPEFLPPEIREALLLKMLMLAISPDYMPSPAPLTEMTTAAPTRKQVRNVQVLGEEGSMDEMKRSMQRH